MRKVATAALQFAVFIESTEHGSLACAPSGHFVRCPGFSGALHCYRFSGVQIRWENRLQVWNPNMTRAHVTQPQQAQIIPSSLYDQKYPARKLHNVTTPNTIYNNNDHTT